MGSETANKASSSKYAQSVRALVPGRARESIYHKPEFFEENLRWYHFFRATAFKNHEGPITVPVVKFS